MKCYLAIDGGTTNVRLHYTREKTVLQTVCKSIGVGNGEHLAQMVADGIRRLSEAYGTPDAILAGGMITSELGLYALPHLPLPAGIRELHAGMKEVLLPEISPQPIFFIPGLRQFGDDFRRCDMMRGEECEIFGLLLPEDGDCIYVLPGSHSKHIIVENGKITSFSTFLSGEMVAALCSNTILRFSVDRTQPLNETALEQGCEFSVAEGIGKALFKVRILDTVCHEDASWVYSFFLGSVLANEICALEKVEKNRILLAGQPRLAEAAAILLRQRTSKQILLADADRAAAANVLGMIRIYEAD